MRLLLLICWLIAAQTTVAASYEGTERLLWGSDAWSTERSDPGSEPLTPSSDKPPSAADYPFAKIERCSLETAQGKAHSTPQTHYPSHWAQAPPL